MEEWRDEKKQRGEEGWMWEFNLNSQPCWRDGEMEGGGGGLEEYKKA